MTRIRKSHTKSRSGCFSCKRRHTKCGEERPSCQKCIDHQLTCVYNDPRLLEPPRSSVVSSPAFVGQENPSPSPARQASPIDSHGRPTRMEELQLMLHYMNSTYLSLVQNLDVNVWKTEVIEEAVQHEYLMDGLLALSALHMAVKHPESRQKYIAIALNYQNEGLRRYTNALARVTKDNGHALFAYAVITPVLALAFPSADPQTDASDCCKSLASMFELLQGVGVVNRTIGDSLRFGKFEPLFAEFPTLLGTKGANPDAASAMSKLRERAGTVAKYVHQDKLAVYNSGIEGLELVFESVAKSNHTGLVMAWPTMVQKQLLKFFKEEDPMAQLIFLHYGVLLLYVHDRWWGRNFGTKLIHGLTASLSNIGPEWASWTSWANETSTLVMQEVQRRSTQQTPEYMEDDE